MKTSAELRSLFLDFFRQRGHEVVSSSPLVPANDPTLLFTAAGMVQFKDTFLGREKRTYTRAATSQRCLRAGGKHNDLENVGYTSRHHTFFEMLGNFSFGDYFKHDAILYAWEFLTQELDLPEDKLWVTVFDQDAEAEDIWLNKIKVDPSRFSRIGAKDNFWSMGDTGPCGPCTEIFYDHGDQVPGGPPGSPDEDGDRYVEIWNLVFMQYDRDKDGNLNPLPKPSVDTGMGLERLAAVAQGVHSNYDIDLFQHLIRSAAKVTGCKNLADNSLKVIADHIRACAFLVVDGVLPSNEGRGYVLRRIIRRAIRHGYQLGQTQPFFHRLVQPLSDEMGQAHPELTKSLGQVERVLLQEEERFAETLEQGMKILDQDIHGLKDVVIPGETVFRLYDTYGFPVDLTADIAREKGLALDMDGFEQAMDRQRDRARAASRFAVEHGEALGLEGKTDFTGYEALTDRSKVVALVKQGQSVDELQSGEEGMAILEHTPFYAESGGQVGDQGQLSAPGVRFDVRDTHKYQGAFFAHIGKLSSGGLKLGDTLEAHVDSQRRNATALNHSATHLLHAALRQVLGEHVAQKGSLVDGERLRFDFSHFEPMSADQIQAVEDLVNEQIRMNNPVITEIMSFDQAQETGAMALFGEKYGDTVRVLRIGAFSTELCGGTHVSRAGDIGLFKITSEGGIASGVRRVEGLTGSAAVQYVRQMEHQLNKVSELLKGTPQDCEDKVVQLLEKGRRMEKEIEQLKGKLANTAGSELASQATEIDGVKVLAAHLDGADPKSLRDTTDQLKNKLGSAVVLLATVTDGKVSLVAGVTKAETKRIKAGELVNMVAQQVGGRGGGRPDMAQAGGNDPAALEVALSSVQEWVREKLTA